MYIHRIPLLPRILEKLNMLIFHCYIPVEAEIGEGFEVGYWGVGVVIHPRARIGRNVFVANGVTVGGRNESPRLPTIEDDVFVATGAKLLGDITVGRGSVIGANAVVIRSVPPRSIAVGVPARISKENIDGREYTGWPKAAAEEKASRLRIFHMVNSFEVGGSEHQMVEVAARQKAKGHHILVGCLSSRGPLLQSLERADISAVEFDPKGGMFRPRGIYQLIRLTWFLATHRFDVVQTHDLYSTLLAVPAAWLAGVKVILSCRRDLSHWSWYTPRNRQILRWIQGLSNAVVVNSKAVRDYLIQKDRFNPDSIRVLYNGIDFGKFSSGHVDRQKLFPQFDSRCPLIAVVANMNVETKGHTDLIRAAGEVIRQFPNVRFLLIGDGQERARLEEMTAQLNLSENILFLGRRDDVSNLLACCDMFVLPSWAEGLPNSVLEAMAARLPVVATKVGGIPELIEDGVNGLLVPPKDPSALATAINRLLEDPALADKLAQGAQGRARAEFSFERLLSELDKLYGLRQTQTAGMVHAGNAVAEGWNP
jgi:glycosyltransferase involved in cell wall biosynthesis/serine acetyltransferase